MSGESKQIDEDENGPENGGMKSGPCLIAGFHALNDISPSYYNPTGVAIKALCRSIWFACPSPLGVTVASG
mgnify:CR=1 FL=1